MNSRWNVREADDCINQFGEKWGKDLALTVYATRLVGSEPDLVLHGGGNTSLKCPVKTLCEDEASAIFVKASGASMDRITPAGFICLDAVYLEKVRSLGSLTDTAMADVLRTHLLRPADSLPSIETLMHAFIGHASIIHTHPNAILCLSNRSGGEEVCREAFGNDALIIPYANAGLALACSAANAMEAGPGCSSLIIMHHGLVTWGPDPKQAYDMTVEMVSRAEHYISSSRRRTIVLKTKTSLETAHQRYHALAPLLRGLLSPPSGDPDNPHKKVLLAPLITEEIVGLLSSTRGRELALSAPLTPDYLVRTKPFSLWFDETDYDDHAALRGRLAAAIDLFSSRYGTYIGKYSSRLPDFNPASADALPRVLMLQGVGVICAGRDMESAMIARDIAEQSLRVKRDIHETGGTYRGLAEEHLFDMEFRSIQRAKVGRKPSLPLVGSVAIVTGAAGAIGSGICEELLSQGCCVAVTDLLQENLDKVVSDLRAGCSGETPRFDASRVLGVKLDVTDADSVSRAFDAIVEAFGGIDIVVINAGLALAAPLVGMDLDAFRSLERVNIEGTLNCLSEAGRRLKTQGMGGDIVLVSTKNVFSPGAGFGAYSATKAASHQLCRIASLEFADMHVRVNMVAPDAVFSHGNTKSGLWAKVGPDRMKARNLDEKGLEEYYRQRNLLKTSVTARHVAKAVLFFATRQTPTTGATIPVDGGLPDATPR